MALVDLPLLLCTIRSMLGNLDPESEKFLFVESRIQKNFPCEIQPESWALESKK